MDLQCCQCHDHPLIDDYYQDDYYGLFAFVHRTGLFTDAKTRLISLTEKADGEASFKSVAQSIGRMLGLGERTLDWPIGEAVEALHARARHGVDARGRRLGSRRLRCSRHSGEAGRGPAAVSLVLSQR